MTKKQPHHLRKSFRKWAMPGQHNGIGTLKQQEQSAHDKRKHEESDDKMFAMRGQTAFAVRPWTIDSHRNFRPNRHMIQNHPEWAEMFETRTLNVVKKKTKRKVIIIEETMAASVDKMEVVR